MDNEENVHAGKTFSQEAHQHVQESPLSTRGMFHSPQWMPEKIVPSCTYIPMMECNLHTRHSERLTTIVKENNYNNAL